MQYSLIKQERISKNIIKYLLYCIFGSAYTRVWNYFSFKIIFILILKWYIISRMQDIRFMNITTNNELEEDICYVLNVNNYVQKVREKQSEKKPD